MDLDSEDVSLASLLDKNKNDNSNVEEEELIMNVVNNDNDDYDDFPVCDIDSCNVAIYSICDNCNYCLCEDHLKLGSCDNAHALTNQSSSNISVNIDDNTPKPTNPRDDTINTCEIGDCKKELYAACAACYRYLCFNHLDNSICNNDHQLKETEDSSLIIVQSTLKTVNSSLTTSKKVRIRPNNKSKPSDNLQPESFVLDGSRKEGATVTVKENKLKNKKNIKKTAKEQRNRGEQYVSVTTKKTIPARKILKDRCNGEICKKFAHNCLEISDEDRSKILEDFYETGSLELQREFIARYVKKIPTKKKTTQKEHSRRTYTFKYVLPKKHCEISVCKKLFLNTLCVSEKTVRTTMSKLKESGVLETEKRGGRPQALRERDEIVRNSITEHINRFPRIESHYCRASTSREYLHPDLSLYKMLEMFNRENEDKGICTSYYTYSSVFRGMNLGFHHPKKDQCGLCYAYRSGDQDKKSELEERYQSHIAEKKAVRNIKQHIKDHLVDDTCICATFDLQQIILLPIAADSKLFYHRRLTNFNLTIYNIANSDCSCYVWHEALGRRGSCEIASCLYEFLTNLDHKNVKEVFLFSDGCCGQNKNSAIAAMMLHVVNTSQHIRSISLRFFEPYHGQNEGDSAHSAINSALGTAGNVYVPSELKSIIRLSRRKHPYTVNSMENSDFLDFMDLAKKLRILTVRRDDDGMKVNWPKMVEYMVLKEEPTKIFFKTSHVVDLYSSLTIPRSDVHPSCKPNRMYKKNEPKLKRDKYNDLMGLCSGPTPIVRGEDNVLFYKNLRHD